MSKFYRDPSLSPAEFIRRVEALTAHFSRGLGGEELWETCWWQDWPFRGIPSLPPGPGSSQLLPSIYHHHLTLHIAKVSLGASLYRGPLAKDFNTLPLFKPQPTEFSSLSSQNWHQSKTVLLKIWQVGWRLPWALPAHPPTWTHLACLPTRTVLGTSSLLRPHFSQPLTSDRNLSSSSCCCC